MIAAFWETRLPIVVPVNGSQQGNPVLFSPSLFQELLCVVGDRGGRDVVRKDPERVATVPFPSFLSARDVDTWEDYEALCSFVDSERFDE